MACPEQIERARLLAKALIHASIGLDFIRRTGRMPFVRPCDAARQPSVASHARNRGDPASSLRLRERHNGLAIRGVETFDGQQHPPTAALPEIRSECLIEPRYRR